MGFPRNLLWRVVRGVLRYELFQNRVWKVVGSCRRCRLFCRLFVGILHRSGNSGRHLLLPAGHRVRIDVRRDRNVGMPKPLAQLDDVLTSGERQRGVKVPQAPDRHPFLAHAPPQCGHGPSQPHGIQQLAKLVGEYQPAIDTLRPTAPFASAELAGVQRVHRQSWGQALTGAGKRSLYYKTARLQIHLVPLQGHDFPTA